MATINLSEGLILAAEADDKRIRLIIYKNDAELACRKTSLKEIDRFLVGAEPSLFKGRLQLLKDQGNILIKVKTDIVGVTSQEILRNLLIQ